MKNIIYITKITLCFFIVTFYSCRKNVYESPDGNIRVNVGVNEAKVLNYSIRFHNESVILNSALGIILNSDTLGNDVKVESVAETRVSSEYITRGFHNRAVNKYNQYEFKLKSDDRTWNLQMRIYDDGVAYRYIIPASGLNYVKKELSSFRVPVQIPVWYFERNSDWKLKSYAGVWTKTLSDSLSRISSQGPVQGPVILYELPGDKYMAITEAALYNYSGMRLKANEDASLDVNFSENEGFAVEGTVTSPWRVVLLAGNLNELVNSDLITNLNPEPDSTLFHDVSWIKPGRSVWSWWSEKDGFMTPEYEKRFIDRANELGYEYTTIDEGWEKVWPDKWGQLRDICQYAGDKNVGVFVWKHSAELRNPDNDYQVMRNFLDSVKSAGVSGIKIDFMNGESKALIDFDIRALQLCAQRKLMVNFHGCQNPSGEFRTYPNEITREGIRGLELNKMNEHITGNHNVALVFTRCILNNADYTPVGFSNPGNTTWCHQLASAYAFTSPLLTVAEHPDTLLYDKDLSPVLPLIKTVPSVWDETIVLPGSSVEETAVLARRKGDVWYLAVLNGDKPKQITVSPAFLDKGNWKAFAVSDKSDRLRAFDVKEFVADKNTELNLDLKSNGGYLIRFSK